MFATTRSKPHAYSDFKSTLHYNSKTKTNNLTSSHTINGSINVAQQYHHRTCILYKMRCGYANVQQHRHTVMTPQLGTSKCYYHGSWQAEAKTSLDSIAWLTFLLLRKTCLVRELHCVHIHNTLIVIRWTSNIWHESRLHITQVNIISISYIPLQKIYLEPFQTNMMSCKLIMSRVQIATVTDRY